MTQGPAKPRNLLEVDDGRPGRVIGESGQTRLQVSDRSAELLESISERLNDLYFLLVQMLEK